MTEPNWIDNKDVAALIEESSHIASPPYRIIAQAQLASAMRLTGIANILVEIRDLLANVNDAFSGAPDSAPLSDVPAWLDDLADDHMRQPAPMLDGFILDKTLPSPINAVFVRPTIHDQDGVGQVDFIATISNGSTVETTRVLPLPGQSDD